MEAKFGREQDAIRYRMNIQGGHKFRFGKWKNRTHKTGIGHVAVADISRLDVSGCLSDVRKRSPSQAHQTLILMNTVFKWARAMGYIDTNPAEGQPFWWQVYEGSSPVVFGHDAARGHVRIERDGEPWLVGAGERVAAPMGVGYAWFGKGLLAEAAGDLAAARVCIERSLAIDEQINDRHEVLNDRLKLLTVCLELGDLDTARAQGRLMSELAAFCPGSREVGGREQAYGLLAIADGRPDAARTHLLGALQAFAPTQMVDIFLRTLGMFAGIVTPSAATRLAELANEVRTQRLPMLEAVEIVQDVLDL